MEIRTDNLDGREIAAFLDEHLTEMRAVSPPESKHALDLDGLKAPGITFWSVYHDERLVGCGALKDVDSEWGEIKAMRVRASARGTGVGSYILRHIIGVAEKRGYSALRLETGSMDYFLPARNLYLKFGFTYCEPFGDYEEDPNSVFMELAYGQFGSRLDAVAQLTPP